MIFYIIKIPILFYLFNRIEKCYKEKLKLKIFDKKNEIQIINNFININHAVYISLFSILYNYNYITIKSYDNALYNVLIYNIRDSIKYVYYNLNMKNEMLFHHFILISSILYTFITTEKVIYTYYLSLNFLTEITTPSLNLSHCLHRLNLKHTLYFKVSSFITFILFFIFRVVMTSFLLYDELNNEKLINKSLCIFQLILVLLNYFWFLKICKMIYKEYKNVIF